MGLRRCAPCARPGPPPAVPGKDARNVWAALGGSLRTFAHRLLSSSFLGVPYRILSMNQKKELLRSLWVQWGYNFSDQNYYPY